MEDRQQDLRRGEALSRGEEPDLVVSRNARADAAPSLGATEVRHVCVRRSPSRSTRGTDVAHGPGACRRIGDATEMRALTPERFRQSNIARGEAEDGGMSGEASDTDPKIGRGGESPTPTREVAREAFLRFVEEIPRAGRVVGKEGPFLLHC
jgi:hypothetical protein